MLMSAEGVTLRLQDYGEDDRMLTILTREQGVIYAYARGARRMKSKRDNAAMALGVYSRFILFKNKDRYNIDGAESLQLFYGLREDLVKLSLASYFCELMAFHAPQGEKAEEFLRLLLNTLYLVEKGEKAPLLVKAAFELRLLAMAGYMPNLVGCISCGEYASDPPGFYLDVVQGTLLCSHCRQERAEGLGEPESYASACREQLLPDGVLAAMRHILYADFEKLFRFQLGGESLTRLSRVSEDYLLAQTERNYNTLDFLKNILPSG